MPLVQPEPEPLLVVGETDFRGHHRPWGLYRDDRLRHLYLIGRTGVGKSTLLANLIRQDLANGEGLALIDPHGELVDEVLPFVPKERTNDVLLFAPEDKEFPVSFNPFRTGRGMHADPSLLASQLVSVFRAQWSSSWGPRLEHLLRSAIMAVAPDPRATFLFLYRFLTDEALRERIAPGIADPVVRHFWTREFPGYSSSFRTEALSPVLNKLGAFVENPVTRNILAQERSRIDFRELLDRRRILLAKLPVGAIGEDASRLLGGLLVTCIQLAAMERGRRRPEFWVYIDELQRFVNDSLSILLSEARKFGVGVCLANQFTAQLPPPTLDAIRGNVGTMLAFRVGAEDAKALESEFSPEFAASDLERLAKYHLAARVLARGESLHAFSARTRPPPPVPEDAELRVERIVRQSRARYAAPRADVERWVERALGSADDGEQSSDAGGD